MEIEVLEVPKEVHRVYEVTEIMINVREVQDIFRPILEI